MIKYFDAKYFQACFLFSFLCFGIFYLDFQITWLQSAVCLLAAIASQYFFLTWFGVRQKSYLSPIITALSLCLLLRSNTLWVHPIACMLAMGSKFLIQLKTKHIFNPANFGIMICLFCLPAWVSPGQWGRHASFVFLFVMLGWLVTQRAKVGGVSIFFLLGFTLLIFTRHTYLGFEHTMTLHALTNGAVLVFAFFMISDPKTNPRSLAGRLCHIFFVLMLFGIFQYVFYLQSALFLALFVAAPVWPVWDSVWKMMSQNPNHAKIDTTLT